MILSHLITDASAPVDQTAIATSVRLSEDLGTCSPHELNLLPPGIRDIVRSITTGAKNKFRFPSKDGTPPPRHDPRIPTRTIGVDGYDTITLLASKDPVWSIYRINFNPGKLIFGHNGRILTEENFLHALSVLIELVTPLLSNPGDWIHIVPGLHVNSRAWWRSLEIPCHVLDEDGAILKAFTNAKHPDINLPPLHKRQGQTVTFANSTGTLLVRVYRKDIQMEVTKPGGVTNPQPVLRLEVALKDDKLGEYFGGGTWKSIEGIRRLVGFRPSNLKQAWLDVMTKFQGCYARVPAMDEKNDKWGRFMGWVAFRTGLSFQDQFDYVRQSFAFNNKEAESNTKSRLYKAACAEISLLSPVQFTDLFSEQRWNNQPNLTIRNLEAMSQARHQHIDINPLVGAVYGSKSQTTIAIV
jgi:hypothetical protein